MSESLKKRLTTGAPDCRFMLSSDLRVYHGGSIGATSVPMHIPSAAYLTERGDRSASHTHSTAQGDRWDLWLVCSPSSHHFPTQPPSTSVPGTSIYLLTRILLAVFSFSQVPKNNPSLQRRQAGRRLHHGPLQTLHCLSQIPDLRSQLQSWEDLGTATPTFRPSFLSLKQ